MTAPTIRLGLGLSFAAVVGATLPDGRDRDDGGILMLDKVRKLLAKAEDPACTPAEAEALTAKATQLMTKYGLDQALLAAREPDRDRVGDRRVALDAPYAREKEHLLHTVARGLRCRSVSLRHRGARDGELSVHLFGFDADLDCVELLFASLLVQAVRALAAEPAPPGAQPAAWRRSWYVGFAAEIGLRFLRLEQRAGRHERMADGPGVALVLADRVEAVERAVHDHYPKLARGRRRRLSGGGFESGSAAGRRADLGGLRMPAANRQALSD